MVPVKIYKSRPYYKQKTGRVMKNILRFVMLLFCCNLYAAQTDFGNLSYLSDAANAWASVVGAVGPSGDIARYIQSAEADSPQFMDTVAVLAYNDTAFGIFEITQHVNMAFSVADTPLAARRSQCPWNVPGCSGDRHTLLVDGQVFATYNDYDSRQNGDFKTHNTGVSVRASGYVSDGMTFGVSYTRTMTDTRDNRVYTDATSNSITLYSNYLAKNGFFINAALNGGHTSWDADKTIAGVKDNNLYDTDFYAGQISAGMQMPRGRITLTPQLGVKYIRLTADKHTDAAAQEYEKWWYNTLTGMAGVRVGFDFIGTNYVVRPNIIAGGSYDLLSHGSDHISVRVVSGQSYNIPVEIPHRSAFNTGAGLTVYGQNFSVGADYKLDVRKDYVSHTAMVNLKIAF